MKFLFKLSLLLSKRRVKTVLSLVLTLTLGLMVIATIYFTLFDLQWLAFLGGVLFAAVLSMASQASKAEWLIMRRTTQLERAREDIKREAARRKIAEDAIRATDTRMRMVFDLMPSPIMFVDRDLRIHEHNTAAKTLTRIPDVRIENQLLRDIVGAQYMEILPHCREALTGTKVEYQILWPNGENYRVKHVPHPVGTDHPLGFYMVMLSMNAPAAAPTVPREDTAENNSTYADAHAAITSDSGETLYLHSIGEQLMGGDDPRGKLIQAIERDEFILFAQKILPLKPLPFDNGSYEILLRLKEEEDNLLPPGGFIPVAERYGLTEDIDRWVIRTVFSWSMQQKRDHPEWDIPMYCVNLSESSVGSMEFARYVRTELQRSGFPASQLCFEIGELDTIAHHANVASFIAALKPVGCRVTVDAFGSIKLSFAHLSGLPVDFIKIDGVLIQNLFKTPMMMNKLKAIVGVCEKLGVRTIAEFVEDDKTLVALKEAGIDYAQGFGIDRPSPISKVLDRKA